MELTPTRSLAQGKATEAQRRPRPGRPMPEQGRHKDLAIAMPTRAAALVQPARRKAVRRKQPRSRRVRRSRACQYIRENKTIAAMGPSFYGRVFFWIEQQPIEKPATLYHWTLLSADELTDYNAGKVLRLGGHIEASGTNWVRFNFQTHNNPGETGLSDPQLVLSTKRWYCAEFYYSLPDNEARIWLDGVEDPKLHWKGPMGGYTFPAAVTWMTFGWAEYQAAHTPWEIWIDEIAIDTKPIGCN